MSEQKRTEELLKSSSKRIKSHSTKLLRDPVVKAAVQREQNPARKKATTGSGSSRNKVA